MTKATPGPWHVVYVGGGDFEVHNTEGMDVLSAGDVGKAAQPNHYLAAAAPDLYEALTPMLRGKEQADYYCPDDVAEDHTVLISVSIAELRAARAALAKANGPGEHGPSNPRDGDGT